MKIGIFNRIATSATLVSIAAIGLVSDETFAASQGTLASTSTGTMSIGVIKPARANITHLSDLLQPSWTLGDGDVTLTEDVCVYSTRPSGGYTVQASGSGGSGAFTLVNGSHNLSYSVAWNAGGVNALSNSGTALTANALSGGFTHAATDSSTCNGTTPGPTARLIVGVSSVNLAAAIAGNYTGTLTLLVTPN